MRWYDIITQPLKFVSNASEGALTSVIGLVVVNFNEEIGDALINHADESFERAVDGKPADWKEIVDGALTVAVPLVGMVFAEKAVQAAKAAKKAANVAEKAGKVMEAARKANKLARKVKAVAKIKKVLDASKATEQAYKVAKATHKAGKIAKIAAAGRLAQAVKLATIANETAHITKVASATLTTANVGLGLFKGGITYTKINCIRELEALITECETQLTHSQNISTSMQENNHMLAQEIARLQTLIEQSNQARERYKSIINEQNTDLNKATTRITEQNGEIARLCNRLAELSEELMKAITALEIAKSHQSPAFQS